MRTVIYKEWVRADHSSTPIKEGYNIEKPGLFHGIFNAWDYADGATPMPSPFAIIEKEDGSMMEMHPSLIRFVDKPEDEQLAEFAKAAMQGLCSSFVNDEADRDEYNYAAMSVMIAKATIEELKKQTK